MIERATINSKSPLMVLNETSIKYNLKLKIEDCQKVKVEPTGDWQFKTIIQCNNCNSIITGVNKSKQVAKQTAAANMLQHIVLCVKYVPEEILDQCALKNYSICESKNTDFVGELNGKSPLMILNEIATKYNLRLEIADSDQIRVEPTGDLQYKRAIHCSNCGSTITGINKSKQASKQIAAANMLQHIVSCIKGLPATMLDQCSLIRDDICDNKTTDFIGELNKLHQQYGSEKPSYDVADISGPSHMQSFTIVCTAFSISQTATASKLKLAKQKAAEKVFNLISTSKLNMGVGTAAITEKDLGLTVYKSNHSEVNIQQAKREFAKLKKLTATNKYTEQHFIFVPKIKQLSASESQQLLYLCKAGRSNINLKTAYIRKKLMEILKIEKPQTLEFKSKQQEISIVGFKLLLPTPLVEIATGNTVAEAEYNAVCKILDKLYYLLNFAQNFIT